MNTKLTLRLGERLIAEAKMQAKRNGKSLSQMVSDYFHSLMKRSTTRETPLTPLTASLIGSLKKSKASIREYRRHLEEKYL